MSDPTERYLELVKRAVLDELYLEHELRFEYLFEVLDSGRTPDLDQLRDPMRQMRVRAQQLMAEHKSARYGDDERLAPFLPLTIGRRRLDSIEHALDAIRDEQLEGDMVVAGAGRGGTGVFIQAWLDVHDMTDRTLWVVDEFRPPPAGAADLNAIRDAFDRFDVTADNVRFVHGDAAKLTAREDFDRVALLQIGASAGPTASSLRSIYPHVTPGGFVFVDDAASDVGAQAVTAVLHDAGESEVVIERLDSSAGSWRKRSAATSERSAHGPEQKPCDLSVVVVFYNMRREAARTLHSLSRAYQEGIDDVDYEVLVVENGSAPEQCLGEAYVKSFGPEFRYLDMGSDASPSPVGALNAGVARARGDFVALMIDGAHVLTPGVLRFGLVGLRTYAPAIVATQQWYVGPGQQPQTIVAGYDQAAEDELFEAIDWPGNGYRLFDIGQFIGDRDWFDGLWESNCLFVPRTLIEQSGAFDEAFSMPGGGFANLELYERLGSTPGVTSVTMLGEGSFHQVHGGTTTNQPEVDARHGELASYSDHFADLRGQSFRGHGKPTHYVGAMRPNTMRSRSRRRTPAHFAHLKETEGPDGLPAKPVPIPEDLRDSFIEAFWNSMAWKKTTWLGWKTGKAPTDLFVYQELIHRVRPDWIVETNAGPGGRTLLLASVCELLDCGHVVSVSSSARDERPQHPRLTYIDGVTHEKATAKRVSALVNGGRALVILGTRGSRQRIKREFDLYAPLVPIGSYVVIEDTVVNGHPVWPGFGSGPMEAVKGIVNKRARFSSDHDLERYGLTFNPGGFLRRVR